MYNNSRILLLIFNLLFLLAQGRAGSEDREVISYGKISGLFDAYSENDERAMVYVNMYIDKAKREHNFIKEIRGYEEAIYYSKNVDHKLLYADSAIITAKKFNDIDQISRAFLGKGIIYYYNKKQYRPALQEYLTAFRYSKNSKDKYLKNKIVYHLGMVKNYLGYYEEAAGHFEQTADYFERRISEILPPNVKLNNESGYFNSIYRLSTCYRNLNLFEKEDSLINIGLKRLNDTKSLAMEYAYFQKARGIQLSREKKTDEALQHLKISEEIFDHNQNYTSLSTVYFYLGKLYWLKGQEAQSVSYLNKMDSLVNKYEYVTPEIRTGYEYLIDYSKEIGDNEKQFYYTKQLIKVNSILNADFTNLSAKIHTEYDTDKLVEEKNLLERKNNKSLISFWVAIIFGLVFLTLLYIAVRKLRKKEKDEKELNTKYQELWEKFKSPQKTDLLENNPDLSLTVKSLYSPEIIDEIKVKLKNFEANKLFLKKNLTLEAVSKMLGTNRTHLSYVLNDHLDTTFTIYLKDLRIKYVTDLLMENGKYLNYTVDSLADLCGMSNRKYFSTHFTERNGLKPADFIRRRKDELKKV